MFDNNGNKINKLKKNKLAIKRFRTKLLPNDIRI